VTASGKFISLEGGEGAGKSTQVRALAQALQKRGLDVLMTREPGGSDGAEKIRDLLLSGSADRWSTKAETLLFAAARADHFERTIEPALKAGRWVVCDRFVDSSLAYQGGAGTVGLVAPRAIAVTYPSGLGQNLTARIVYDGPVRAPIAQGQHIADLVVTTADMPPQTMPLVAANDVGPAGFFGRVWAAIMSFFA
jgi:dTMP kinase